MSRLRALLAPPVLVVAIVAAWASPAGANCPGPQISVAPQEARPGESVLVSGEGFGTACNDAGRPGQSVLGDPQTDISIYLDSKGERQLLERIDADSDYRFAFAFSLPVATPSGTGIVVAASSDSGEWPSETSGSFEVSGSAVRADDPQTAQTPDNPEDPGDSWFSPLSLLAGVAVVSFLAVLGVARHRRRAERADALH